MQCEYCRRESERYIWIDDDDGRHYFCSTWCASEQLDISEVDVEDIIYSECGSEDNDDDDEDG